MLMDVDNAAAQANTASPFAGVAARVQDWCRRLTETEAMLANDIAHPAKSAVAVWGVPLLPGADMGAAIQSLASVSKALTTVRTLGAVLGGPQFRAMNSGEQIEVGKRIEHQMWLVETGVRLTIEAIRRANLDLAGMDQAVADGLLAADTFIVDKAPEIVGDIAAVLTANKQAGAVVENAGKVLLRGVTEVSHVAQGGKAGGLDKQVGSLRDKAIDALIDTAASWVPGKPEGARAALRIVGASMVKSALKAAKGKEGPELQEALISGLTSGLLSALEKLAEEVPGLKDQKLRQKLMGPFLKGVAEAVKAMVEGKSVKEGFTDGITSGVVAAGIGTLKSGLEHSVSNHPENIMKTIDPAAINRLRDVWTQQTFSVTIHPSGSALR